MFLENYIQTLVDGIPGKIFHGEPSRAPPEKFSHIKEIFTQRLLVFIKDEYALEHIIFHEMNMKPDTSRLIYPKISAYPLLVAIYE
jgi:hypothetical protein